MIFSVLYFFLPFPFLEELLLAFEPSEKLILSSFYFIPVCSSYNFGYSTVDTFSGCFRILSYFSCCLFLYFSSVSKASFLSGSIFLSLSCLSKASCLSFCIFLSLYCLYISCLSCCALFSFSCCNLSCYTLLSLSCLYSVYCLSCCNLFYLYCLSNASCRSC